MERAEHDESRGEPIPGRHGLDNDPEHSRSDEAGAPKRRSRHVLWTGGITVLLICAVVVGVVAFSAGEGAIGDSAIPVDEPAVFDSPPSLEAAVLDGWQVTDGDDSPTSVRNTAMKCVFNVQTREVDPSDFVVEDPRLGDMAATEITLSEMSNVMMKVIGNMKQVGELKRLSVPHGSPGEPGLEFITTRLDYLIPGTGEPATIRLGVRSMPRSGGALTATLLCPTSVLDAGNDPWKDLMTNSIVVVEE